MRLNLNVALTIALTITEWAVYAGLALGPQETIQHRSTPGAEVQRESAKRSTPHGRLEVSRPELVDRIHGGLVGQLLGNLNGLPHEMKYIHEPGAVTSYTPDLRDGARTDDDTDIEWVYVVAMEQEGKIRLAPERIVELWKTHISDRIWCANDYARRLMDLGLLPPATGRIELNPWARFNISGQFLCESFGLIAPAMPQTAASIGLHYTRVAIEGEPAQTTQLFIAMIATAFTTDDLVQILEAGLAALDPRSDVAEVVRNVREWHRQFPNDWRAARARLKEAYSRHGGAMRDRNGYELNTGATIAALLYGQGDLVETLRTAFNFGWDADNSAATAGTIVGVMHGFSRMEAQGWSIRDRYHNTTRPGMPDDETISRFRDRLVVLAERVILEQGGSRVERDGTIFYRIPPEKPANILPLDDPRPTRSEQEQQIAAIAEAITNPASGAQTKARAAYLAICLDAAPSLAQSHPTAWEAALAALREYSEVLRVMAKSPTPDAESLRRKARAVGLRFD